MKAVGTQVLRAFEATIMREDGGVSGCTLMDRAGYAVAEAVLQYLSLAGIPRAEVLCVAGKGNNGGDAFVAARYLQEAGCRCTVWMTCCVDTLSGDALEHFRLMDQCGCSWAEKVEEDDWTAICLLDVRAHVIVDAVLGTGAHGAPRGRASDAIQFIRSMAEKAWILSVDIPSGLDGDNASHSECVVTADMTVSMAAPKPGLLLPEALSLVGKLDIADIGLPDVPDVPEQELVFSAGSEIRAMLPKRAVDSHKGSFGHVLVMGGSAQYPGALSLAVGGALYSGCGRVSAAAPVRAATSLSYWYREAIIAAEVHADVLDASLLDDVSPAAFSSVLLGPGLGQADASAELVHRLIREATVPLVLDADALNLLAAHGNQWRPLHERIVLTPHPGEAARLLNVSTKTIQQDRLHAVKQLVERWGAVVVLKGAGTLIAAPGQPVRININGNSGLAKGGSGDILAGLIAGLLAQGMRPCDAACAGVWLHGHAADCVAWAKGKAAMQASDLLDVLMR